MISRTLRKYENDLVISVENGRIHMACSYLLGWDVECGIANQKAKISMRNCLNELESLGCSRLFCSEDRTGWVVDLSFP